jgi:hypothetical protein
MNKKKAKLNLIKKETYKKQSVTICNSSAIIDSFEVPLKSSPDDINRIYRQIRKGV